jgi:hypothetical protein
MTRDLLRKTAVIEDDRRNRSASVSTNMYELEELVTGSSEWRSSPSPNDGRA